jgi:hypothetical protein
MTARLTSTALCSALAAAIAGCEEYRVEYHTRPGFYAKASEYELPSDVILNDGTRVVYSTREFQSSLGRKGEEAGRPFALRTQREDGTINLHALIPDHVLMNTLDCTRNAEYELLYDELLAQRTKDEYIAAGLDPKQEFISFMSRNQVEIARLLTRMAAGLPHQEVAMVPMAENITRCRLRPQVAEPFKFKTVWTERLPNGQQKLVLIR